MKFESLNGRDHIDSLMDAISFVEGYQLGTVSLEIAIESLKSLYKEFMEYKKVAEVSQNGRDKHSIKYGDLAEPLGDAYGDANMPD